MLNKTFSRALCALMALVLLLALAGCGAAETAPETTAAAAETAAQQAPETTAAAETTAAEEAVGVSFQVLVVDPEGKETTFDITTSKETVGEALLEEGLVAGDEGEYGLFITTVNGITLDWDKDQMYWAFYIDGEYATTGVDATPVTPGAVYSLVAE